MKAIVFFVVFGIIGISKLQRYIMRKGKILLFKELDYTLIILTLLCTLFGIIMISSAVKSIDGGSKYVIIQSAAAAIGFVFMVLFTTVNYEKVGSAWKAIYLICIMMLVLVLIVGTGKEDTGSKSWIRFGPIGIQPSEFVKIGFIITFSKHVTDIGTELNEPKNILKLLMHLGILLFLIMLQPDFGTSMVFIFIFLGIIFAAGISYKYIVTAVGTVVGIIPMAWFFFLKEYQKNRIRVFINPESDPLGSGYHVIQSKIAIGSGQLFGKGLYQGTQTQLGYLPVKHTDFIFAVVGEELGLIGCLAVTFMLFAIVYRCLIDSARTKSDMNRYICVGVACMFLAHIFENIGMCIGLMPVTGIPLPFFSYGGSSILTNFAAIGLVLSVHMRKKSISFT